MDFHLNILRPFYEGIEIVDGDGINTMEIRLPNIPDGYLITYLRRKHLKKTNQYSPNIIHISNERIFVGLDGHVPQKNIINVFFENENANQLLEQEDWDDHCRKYRIADSVFR